MSRPKHSPEATPMIDTGRDGDVRQWASLLNTSPVRVKIAVAAVGANVDRVRHFIAARSAAAEAAAEARSDGDNAASEQALCVPLKPRMANGRTSPRAEPRQRSFPERSSF